MKVTRVYSRISDMVSCHIALTLLWHSGLLVAINYFIMDKLHFFTSSSVKNEINDVYLFSSPVTEDSEKVTGR
jgi:hypothetical protein